MTYKNFLITAMGRSGTKFLARNMNRSKQWTVAHEPAGMQDLTHTEAARSRFLRDWYGEVNSILRFSAHLIPAATRGVIFRDPAEIWLSLANKKAIDQMEDALLDDLERSMQTLATLVKEHEFIPISFKLMTTTPWYLEWLFRAFGVDDIEFESDMLQPVNQTKARRFHSMEEFRPETQERIERCREHVKEWIK